MKIHFISDTQVVVEDASDFDLSETFDCGQCFRWNQISENEFWNKMDLYNQEQDKIRNQCRKKRGETYF